jgi:hypothetical protein
MLSHFNNIVIANQNREPLYANLFETTFNLPKSLSNISSNDVSLLTLQATNIDLNLTPPLGIVYQYFKYSGRAFLNTAAKNSVVTFDITFNINVTDKFALDSWNILKQWYDLGWNSQTGELHYKSEMVGTVVAHIHDRKGIVVRRVEFANCQLSAIDSQAFKWDTETILTCKATFVADTWIDLYQNIA